LFHEVRKVRFRSLGDPGGPGFKEGRKINFVTLFGLASLEQKRGIDSFWGESLAPHIPVSQGTNKKKKKEKNKQNKKKKKKKPKVQEQKFFGRKVDKFLYRGSFDPASLSRKFLQEEASNDSLGMNVKRTPPSEEGLRGKKGYFKRSRFWDRPEEAREEHRRASPTGSWDHSFPGGKSLQRRWEKKKVTSMEGAREIDLIKRRTRGTQAFPKKKRGDTGETCGLPTGRKGIRRHPGKKN